MKNQEQRINNIIGQLEGVKKMINSDKSCSDILVQTKAIRSAINSLMDKIVEEELDKCIEKKEMSRAKKIISRYIKQ